MVDLEGASAMGGIPPDIDVLVATIEGPTGPSLVAYADRDDDLLIVGPRQHGPLSRASHGWVAGFCLNHAGCPVLAVPPPAMAKAGPTRALARALRREAHQLTGTAAAGGR